MPQASVHWDFILGNVTLDQFECPEDFSIGWEKNLAEHRYLSSGGTTQINTHVLGVYPVPTKWHGTLFYQTALQRFQLLEALATQITPVVWQYGPLQYLVMVKSCVGIVKHQFEIDYEIDITVLQSGNQTVPFSDLNAGGSEIGSAFYDAGNTAYANFKSKGLAVPTKMQNLYTGMINAITGASPLSGASIQALLSVGTQIGAFLASSAQFLNILKSTPLTEIGNNQLGYGMQMFANFSQLQGVVQQLSGTGATATTISAPAGTSLFTLSGQFYPQLPPGQGAKMIADANLQNDYFVNADTTLTIPPLQSA
jgi:hypothetical protein